MTPDELSTLRSSTLFNSLPDGISQKIVGNEPPRNYAKGQTIFSQGEVADHFYVILSGWVKIYRLHSSGDEIILHIFKSGDSFAEAAMFSGYRYPAMAEAIENTRMLSINCNHFKKLLGENPEIAMSMLASTSVHLKGLVLEIEQMKGRNSLQRLAFFLIDLCPMDATKAVVELPYEKYLVASRLGIQPESLSRLLKKMQGYGVHCNKNKITISDVVALRDLAIED
ncbi:MAG: Crp/Fnr family transcriptional regulator [bacterium]|nr:Crp/Fnr family transcriptional regulator [bacterium]